MAANGSPGGLVDYQMFINNKWVDAQSGETFDSVNPYTGTAWARVPRAYTGLKTVWVELGGASRDPFKLG